MSTSVIKGQISVEFMIIFMILLGALCIAVFISWSNIMEIKLSQADMEVENVLETVAGKINTVWMSGDGFSTNLTLPEKVAGMNYSIYVKSNYIILSTPYKNYTKTILTNETMGNLRIGDNLIKNENGKVGINI